MGSPFILWEMRAKSCGMIMIRSSDASKADHRFAQYPWGREPLCKNLQKNCRTERPFRAFLELYELYKLFVIS